MHNCFGRLGRIKAPTFIVHGAHDRVIPVANAHLIADRIVGSRLRVLERAGHLYPTEDADVDHAIGDFFATN